MFNSTKTNQEKNSAFENNKNVTKMLGIYKKLMETKSKESEQIHDVKPNSLRSKHVLKDHSSKRIAEHQNGEVAEVGSEVDIKCVARDKKSSKNVKATKTERKPFQKTFFLPYLKEEQNQDKESFSKKNSHEKISEMNTSGDTNNTIFISLDVIEDCQKYKKKFITPMCGKVLKSLRKSLENVSSYHRRYLSSVEETRIPQRSDKTYKKVRCENSLQRKKKENSFPKDNEENTIEIETIREPSIKFNNDDAKSEINKASFNDESLSHLTKVSNETFLIKQSSNEIPTSEDVSTVDKKYIELLLSIANCKEKKQNVKKQAVNVTQDDGLKQTKKNKITRKTFCETKILQEKTEEEKCPNDATEKEQTIKETPIKSTERKYAFTLSRECSVLSRLIRDLTKSDMQIQPPKRENPSGEKLTKIPSHKKTTHSKPEVNENRKKRKTRNNVLKKNNEKIFEMHFPRETTNAADVKELWRRETRIKSENSLSSHSASTIQQTDVISECKNPGLESYQILRKIVEEEIKTICKKFVAEKSEKRKIDLTEIRSSETGYKDEMKKLKKTCKETPTMLPHKGTEILNISESIADVDIKGNPVYDEYHNLNLNCEEKKKKNSLLNFLDTYESKHLDYNFLKKKETFPSDTVDNWSILHRLEKAFIALGTPTFPNVAAKDANILKTTDTNDLKKSSKYPAKTRESANQKSKRLQKNNDIQNKKENKNPINTYGKFSKPQKVANDISNSKHPPTKTVIQNLRNENSRSDTKELLKKKKPLETQNLRTRLQPRPAASMQKISEHKTKLQQTNAKTVNQKTNVTDTKTPPKPKTRESESQNLKKNIKQKNCKREPVAKSFPSETPSHEEKEKKLRQQKTLETLNKGVITAKQNKCKNLERKDTFNVLPPGTSLKGKSQKFKSCHKGDSENLLSTTQVTPLSKNLSDSHRNINENSKDNVITNKKSKSAPKSCEKVKVLEPQERPKTTNEKESAERNQENCTISTKNSINQEEKPDKEDPEEKDPEEKIQEQILGEKNPNNGKERIIKERSILSIRNDSRQGKSFPLSAVSAEKLPLYPDKTSEDFVQKYPSKDLDRLIDLVANPPDTLNVNCPSTRTFDIDEFNVQKKSSESDSKMIFKCLRSAKQLETSKESTSLSSMSTCTLEHQQNVTEEKLKQVRNQQIWEQDIKQYRAIVKDIMNHYKRIGGFLRENEHSRGLPHNSIISMTSRENENPEFSKESNNLKEMNIHEYRKKIFSEYESLSIFEYKKKLQEQEDNDNTQKKRRNLSFVKALETEMDLDVKDFQPNIQKILDSQLYVDIQNLHKRKEPYLKSCEKNSSLQDIALNKNQTLKTAECPRCISTPKYSAALPKACHSSSSAQNISTSVHSDIGIETLLLKI